MHKALGSISSTAKQNNKKGKQNKTKKPTAHRNAKVYKLI
jgi:hypothetical protein